nr:unnamed protein product [Callosobruchus analis]
MYTNPFSRTHSSVRQVIDRFLNVDRKKKDSFALKRNSSDCSVYSDSSSWSSSSKNSAKKLNPPGMSRPCDDGTVSAPVPVGDCLTLLQPSSQLQ